MISLWTSPNFVQVSNFAFACLLVCFLMMMMMTEDYLGVFDETQTTTTFMISQLEFLKFVNNNTSMNPFTMIKANPLLSALSVKLFEFPIEQFVLVMLRSVTTCGCLPVQ